MADLTDGIQEVAESLLTLSQSDRIEQKELVELLARGFKEVAEVIDTVDMSVELVARKTQGIALPPKSQD